MDEFKTFINRKNTNSMKWDQVKRVFQTDDDDVLPLWVADMDFPAPKEVNDALIERARHGIYGYTFIDDSIKQNVANWLQKRHGWDVDINWLTFSPSVITSLYNAIVTFTEPGDNVLIQTPVYTPFFSVIKDSGRQLVENPLRYENGTYRMDFADLEEKFRQGTKAMVLCSPHNPVGRVWKKAELEKLAELALAYDVLILSDEIHADLVFEPNKHIPIASLSEEMAKQTITFMSPTKTFNLAGLHISYIVTPDRKKKMEMEKLLALQGFRMLNTMGIIALNAAYEHGDRWLNRLLAVIEENKTYVINRLPMETNGKVDVIDSEGTYLLWLDFRKLNMSDKALHRFLVEEAKVGLNAGSSYGKEGERFMRINLACHKETLQEAIDRIVQAVNKLP
ncbi:MAG: pyridoxal phosphate-dependent aminotransferase [Bacilli bacterium]|nr:pyridoxal phosphate-dependent aminotransferase [Bacilli bacterium]